MHLETALIGSILGFTLSSAAHITASTEVPLLGPSFLSNFDPTNSKAIEGAKKAFPGMVDKLFHSGELNAKDLAFTIDVYSAATNDTIFSYSHVGEQSKKSLNAGELNDHTISRTGSVTKLFTVYAILAKAGMGVFSDPVTKYLPELKKNSSSSSGNPLDGVPWDDITVGALASHQAGSGGIKDFFDTYLDPKNITHYEPQDLFTFYRDKRLPVIAPYHGAIYSDGGFAILGQILARLSNKTYVSDSFDEILWKPLGMNSSSTRVPSGPNINAMNRTRVMDGSTPDEISSWGYDYDIAASTGGIYSSAADLRRAGLSILNSELLSGPTTSEWMKPRSGTGTLVEMVGAPWEITRLEIPTTPNSNRTRISDLYTKGGGNGDYTAIFALSPDHGIGYTILIGGKTATQARWPLRNIVGETFIPAAEHAAAENAMKNLAGRFVDEKNPGNNVTLSVDRGHPGLGLKSFWLDGVNNRNSTHYRLYPTGLNSISNSLSSLYRTEGTMRIAHRSVKPYEDPSSSEPLKPRAAVEGGKGGLFDNSFVWMNLDSDKPLDLFIFTLEDGKVTSVEYPLTEAVMKRVE